MSGRYEPISADQESSNQQSHSQHSRQSSFGTSPITPTRSSYPFPSIRRQSSLNVTSNIIPDPHEMDAAFDDPPSDDDVDGDHRGLLSQPDHNGDGYRFQIGDDDEDEVEDHNDDAGGDQKRRMEREAIQEIQGVFASTGDPLGASQIKSDPVDGDHSVDSQTPGRMPGDYDFDRDYFLPPPSDSPPPFQPYSRQNPAQGNTNGIIPTSAPIIPTSFAGHARNRSQMIGSLLPSYVQRALHVGPEGTQGGGHSTSTVGGGMTGVFANLAARPEAGRRPPGPGEVEGPEWVPEDAQKDAPPTYQAAVRDAVPPYWETTVVLPSSTSPFGTLTSSVTGDEIMIDGMPVGNLFSFAWNCLVSLSFQFVGFLLTYVLHTSHAAKFGSRAGLGITLIQYGLYLRSRAEQMIETGQFPTDASDPLDPTSPNNGDTEADMCSWWNPGLVSPPHQSWDGQNIPSFSSCGEAVEWHKSHNVSMSDILGMPSAADIGQANEWLSFIMMVMGWFLLLTSVGGFWRVRRFENGLRASQNASTTDDPTDELANGSGSGSHRGGLRDLSGQMVNRFENSFSRLRRGMFGRRGGHSVLVNEDEDEADQGNENRNTNASGQSDTTMTAGGSDNILLFNRDTEVDEDIANEFPGAIIRRQDQDQWAQRSPWQG